MSDTHRPPTRLALIIDYSLDYLGGAQTAFLDAATALRQNGHDVLIIAPRSGANNWLQNYRGPVHQIPSPFTIPGLGLPYLRNTRRLQKHLRRILTGHNITTVHTHSEFGLTAAARVAAAQLKLPVVHTVHTFFWEARLPRPCDQLLAAPLAAALQLVTGTAPRRLDLAAAAVDSLLRDCTALACQASMVTVSPSAHQAVTLEAAGVTPVRVVPNPSVAAVSTPPDFSAAVWRAQAAASWRPVAVPAQADVTPRVAAAASAVASPAVASPAAARPAVASAAELPAGAPLTDCVLPLRLVWVGRLVPEKRLLEFITALRLLSEQGLGDSYRVQVLGAGPLAGAAARAATGLPVQFRGRVNRAAVVAAMREAHAVVLTSYGFDNQPVTIVEAVQHGRPVILCDPRLQEGLSGGSGIYTASPAPADIAATLAELIHNPAKLCAASAATLADRAVFDPREHARALQRIYQEVTTR